MILATSIASAVLRLAVVICLIAMMVILFSGLTEFTILDQQFERWGIHSFLRLAAFLLILRLFLNSGRSLKTLRESNPLAAIFLIVTVFYFINGRIFTTGDTKPARYLPLSILREADFDLDEFRNHFSVRPTNAIRLIHDHYVSDYPVGAPILAVPFYTISAIGPVESDNPLVAELEKLSGGLITAASVVMMYLVLSLLTTQKWSFFLSLIYALCTSNLSVVSQGLWQHGASQLCILCALYCLLRGMRESLWIAPSGFFITFAIVCRPNNLFLLAPVGIYVLLYHRREFIRFLLYSLPPVIFHFSYHWMYFNNPFRTQFALPLLWKTPLLEGLSGILFSPAKGLFFYSPVLLFAFVGIVWILRNREKCKEWPLFIALLMGLGCNLLIHSKWHKWWGGEMYGPRIISDLQPIWIIFLIPALALIRKNRLSKALFAAAVIWSFYTHLLGSVAFNTSWHVQNRSVPVPARFWKLADGPVPYHTMQLVDRLNRTLEGVEHPGGRIKQSERRKRPNR